MGITAFDYKEPLCPLSGGEEFYYPGTTGVKMIPVRNIIEKLDSLYSREDYLSAARVLDYWLAEARTLRDRRGELAMQSEMAGLFRRTGDRERALAAANACIEILAGGEFDGSAAAGDVYVNAATTLAAFGATGEAMPYFERARENYLAAFGEGDVRFAAYHNNFGLALSFSGDRGGARSEFLKALALLEGDRTRKLDQAITYLNIADTYDPDSESSLDPVERCLQTAIRLVDGERSDTEYYAFVCRKCAPVFDHYGYFDYANELARRADAIYERP